MTRHTRMAKAVYRLSGLVSRIKTYSRTYRVVWDEPDKDAIPPFRTAPDSRRWVPIALTWRLFRWAERLDPEHFGHWALDHATCPGTAPCAACGGFVCPEREGGV